MHMFSSIDATNQKERLCRYANDAPKTESGCNASMKLKVFGNYPRLCLFASRHIQAGEEIRYDYGVSKEHLIWRKNVSLKTINYRKVVHLFTLHFA